jgi:hypothetical protein
MVLHFSLYSISGRLRDRASASFRDIFWLRFRRDLSGQMVVAPFHTPLLSP